MDAKNYLEQLTELIRETQISVIKILDYNSADDFQIAINTAAEKIKALIDYSQGHDEELQTVFQLDYINFLIYKCISYCVNLIKQIDELDEKDIDITLCNLSTIYVSIAVQVQYNANFIAMLDITEVDSNLVVSYYDELKDESIEHMLSPNGIDLLIPVYKEKIDLMLKSEATDSQEPFEYKRNEFFPRDVLVYKNNKLYSLYIEVANLFLGVLLGRQSNVNSLVNKIKDGIDFDKVGLLKTFAIRKKHFDNIFFKIYLMETVYCLKVKESTILENAKSYIISERAKIIYNIFMKIQPKEYWLKINNCFKDIESFKEFFSIQYLIYENLIENADKGEFLIPLTTCYKEHAGLKSVVAAVLADDILLDYYYCDIDFSVNYIKKQSCNSFNSPSLAISDSSKIYEIIYNDLEDF